MTSFTEISPIQLMRLIGTPECPVILDCCLEEDFALAPRLVPSSIRVPHTDIADKAMELQGKRVVTLCQKGLKISHGAAAQLRAQGIQAEVLAGGQYGWREAGLPLVPAKALPVQPRGHTLWVTRHRPKIDRIACPWLIRRFVDPAARVLFVPPSAVQGVAEKFAATPFDIEDVFWSHRGELCTFDVMLDEFALHTEALDRLATVIRAADTNRHDLAPQAAGLLALSVGLSRQYKDDQQQLEAGMALYDALYRWARDGAEEGHDWPAGRGS